jgi:hypothetical protein
MARKWIAVGDRRIVAYTPSESALRMFDMRGRADGESALSMVPVGEFLPVGECDGKSVSFVRGMSYPVGREGDVIFLSVDSAGVVAEVCERP